MKHYPGVYVGKCLPTGKVYVGSSLHVYRRINEHKRALAKRKHGNKHLQFAYNKYGAENFTWEIVAEFYNGRFLTEQFWIEKLRASDPKFGFNCSNPVRASYPNPTASHRMKQLWKDPKQREKWEAGLAKGSKIASERLRTDPAFAAKISQIRRNQWSSETKANLAAQAKKRYSNKTYKKEHLSYLASGRIRLKELRKNPKFVRDQTKGIINHWKNPEARKSQAARMAALWNNPEFRAKQIERAIRQIKAVNEKRRAASADVRDSPNNSKK